MTDRSSYALGKRPPSNAPALMLRDVLTGVVPPVPAAADHASRISQWNLGRNDRFGTCGPTGVSNLLLLVTTYLTGQGIRVTDDDIADLYRRSGNPRFDPNAPGGGQDNGVILQEMLGALLKGGIAGHKPVAYAKIAPEDMDTLDAAVALFGGVLLGLTLDVAQQRQTTWDYSPSGTWGGHCVLACRFTNPAGDTADRTGVVTWAEVLDTTRTFVAHQEDEAWVVIWPEHLTDQTFLAGVDVAALESAYESLTGRGFTVPVTPDPQPPADPAGAMATATRRLLDHHHQLPAYFTSAASGWLATQP